MSLQLRNIGKSFDGKTVLQDVNAVFTQDGNTCLMGPSGCGKTTLLRILMGLAAPDGGRIEGLSGLPVAAVFQEDRLCDNLDVFRNIALVSKITRSAADAELAAVGLHGVSGRPAGLLSGGMKRRAAIVRALAADSGLVLLDEPFKGLDGDTKRLAAAYILAKTAGKIVIAATHDDEDAALLDAAVLRLPMRG